MGCGARTACAVQLVACAAARQVACAVARQVASQQRGKWHAQRHAACGMRHARCSWLTEELVARGSQNLLRGRGAKKMDGFHGFFSMIYLFIYLFIYITHLANAIHRLSFFLCACNSKGLVPCLFSCAGSSLTGQALTLRNGRRHSLLRRHLAVRALSPERPATKK